MTDFKIVFLVVFVIGVTLLLFALLVWAAGGPRSMYKMLENAHTPPVPAEPPKPWKPHVIIHNGRYVQDPPPLEWQTYENLQAYSYTEIWCERRNAKRFAEVLRRIDARKAREQKRFITVIHNPRPPEWIEGPRGCWARNNPIPYHPSGRPGIDY